MSKISSPERGVTVTYEAIRQWCRTFGFDYARRLRRRRGRMGDTWYLDELFVKSTLLMNGQRSEIRENGWVEIEDQALETGQRKWKHRFG